MRRIIRLLIWVVFFVLIAGTGSYAGARFKAGQILGPRSPVGGRTSTLAYKGVENLPGNPRAWVFTYNRVTLPGVQQARIVVSLSGKILSTTPRDLEERIDRYRESLLP